MPNTSNLEFVPNGHLTLGIELELQLLNSSTYDLQPEAINFLEKVTATNRIKPEIFQSMIEVNTDICNDLFDVKSQMMETFKEVDEICESLNIKYSTTGTHPFARYSERIIYPSKRYNELIDRNQWIARRLCIFGLHVHIGMKSADDCIDFMNFYQHFLPQFAALTASSPFWQSKDTGLASSRMTVFEASPTSGHAQYIKNWEGFQELVATLTKCKAIKSTKDLWWDIRPAPHFGSLEIRICDGTASLHELLAVVSYIHLLAIYFDRYKNDAKMLNKLVNNYTDKLPLWMIRENKWRAIRHGLEMEFIRCDNSTVNLKQEIENNIELLSDLIEEYNYHEFIGYLKDILKFGNSFKRQKAKYNKHKSFKKVVQMNANDCKESFINNYNCIRK